MMLGQMFREQWDGEVEGFGGMSISRDFLRALPMNSVCLGSALHVFEDLPMATSVCGSFVSLLLLEHTEIPAPPQQQINL